MKPAEYVISDGRTGNNSNEICIPSSNSGEDQIMCYCMLSKLSAEAKFIMYAIFNTPGELSKMLFGNKPTEKNIRKYMKCIGWGKKEINRTLNEVQQFSKELLS